MKRILIVNNNMHIGGVQKSLLNLLHEIHGDFDITLLLFYEGGELLKDIPEDIHVITPAGGLRYWGMSGHDVSCFAEKMGRSVWAGMTRLVGIPAAFGLIRLTQAELPKFDVAISFLHSGSTRTFYGGCNEFVLHCVNAKRKVTFLHCDYKKINADSAYNRSLYRQFDIIAACSAGCRKNFLEVMPELANKTVVVPNCHNYEEVQRLASARPIQAEEDKLQLLTVARFGKEKGMLRAIQAIAGLDSAAEKIRYNIIGDGAEFLKAQHMVSDLGLSRIIQLLGKRTNPYGYMQAADVLLIPSVSEAAPMVIGESACLGTPILTTKTSSAYEMVEKTGYGWVCENSVNGIQNGILKLLLEPNMLMQQKERIQTKTFDNTKALEAFWRIVD